jgi:hypothetical protein
VIALVALSLASCSAVTDFFHETYAPTCGNEVVEPPIEDCDPPNLDAGCSTSCRSCTLGGKNVIDPDPEQARCYSAFDNSGALSQPWQLAADDCDSTGGKLVVIDATNAKLQQEISTADHVAWFGLRRINGSIAYAYDGEPQLYTCWGAQCTDNGNPPPTDDYFIIQFGLNWFGDGDTGAMSAPYTCEYAPWTINPETHHAFLALARAASDCPTAETRCAGLGKGVHLATIALGSSDDDFIRERHLLTETLRCKDEHGACATVAPDNPDAGAMDAADYSGYLCEVE